MRTEIYEVIACEVEKALEQKDFTSTKWLEQKGWSKEEHLDVNKKSGRTERRVNKKRDVTVNKGWTCVCQLLPREQPVSPNQKAMESHGIE